MLQQAFELWATRFDEPPTVVATAPGRVNLIGEHTDYNDGYVFPAAINLTVSVLVGEAAEDEFVSVQVPDSVDHRGPGWRRYALACRSALEAQGHAVPAIRAVVDSSVPGGSGLSSSAALEMALLTAWNHIGGLNLAPEALAEVAWLAENEYVGVKVGRMDQMASALGVAGCALFMDMRSLEVEVCPFPETVDLAILDTRKPRSLAAGKYNERVAECARAVAAINAFTPVKSLRDATIEDIQVAVQSGLDDVAARRAKHVVTENARVLEFKTALASSDLRKLGDLCARSHESLRDDYEVTVAELDAMVRAARSAPGCIGARMTGAGFGGCCVALIEAGSFEEFRKAALASYGMYGFATPNLFKVEASDGARAQAI